METKKKKTSQNLVPMKDRTSEERREIASKAGKASVASRQKRKALKELLEIALATTDKDGLTAAQKTAMAMVEKAMMGDTKAFEVIRDTIGEKPTEKSQIDGNFTIGWNK